MSETSIGGISWQVDADTTPAVNSVKAVEVQVNKAEKSLKKLDSATKKTADETKKMSSKIDSASSSVSNLSNQNIKLTKTSVSVNSAVSGMSRRAGMAGIQFQQLIGQIQGGQSAMVALSQQSADLGFVLGAPLLGAVSGIAFSLIGMLLPSLLNSKKAGDSLYSSMEVLNSIVVKSKEGVNALSNEYAALAKANTAAAKVQLAIATIQATESLKSSQAVIKENVSALQGYTTNLEAASKALDYLRKTGKTLEGQLVQLDKAGNVNFGTWKALKTAVDLAGSEFGATSTQAYKLVSALIDVQKSGSVENFNKLDSVIADIANTTGYTNVKFNEFAKVITNASKEGRLSSQALSTLRSVLGGVEVTAEGAADAVKSMVEALKEQALQTNETNRQTALRIALEKGATAEQLKSINASFGVIEAKEKLKEAQKDADEYMKSSLDDEIAREKKRKAFTDKHMADSLKDLIASEKKKKAAIDAESKRVATGAASVADKRGDPVELLKAQKDAELKVLEEAEAAGLMLHTDYATLRKNIDDQYGVAEQAARERRYAAESEMNALMLSTINNMGAATTNVITGLISGTMDAKAAMQQLASAIINDAVGSLVQIGVQHVKNALIEQAVDKTTVTAKQSLAAAAATAHTAAVTAAVVELASLGAAAAMASTAAIPIIGPAAAPAAGAAMSGIITAAGAPAIASAPAAGMREHGGSVLAGNTYEMGEKNKPELLVIPGNNGKVLSNSEMKGLAGGGNSGGGITIHNYAAADGYRVESRRDPLTSEQVLSIVIGQMSSSNSKGMRGMQRVTNVSGVLNGGRRA